jgi:hypothetical protein
MEWILFLDLRLIIDVLTAAEHIVFGFLLPF